MLNFTEQLYAVLLIKISIDKNKFLHYTSKSMEPKLDSVKEWLDGLIDEKESGEIRISLNEGGIGRVYFDKIIFN